MTERIVGPRTQPQFRTVLDQVKRQTMLAINCVQIGTIQKYTAATNTAKVKINFQMVMGNGEIVEYPILDDCPVFTLSGGNSFVSCPIAVGDNCLVLFNDKNIDNWYLKGDTTTPADKRSHSIADGIVLVGVNPINDPKDTPLNSVCVNGGSKKVSIKNSSTDLKTLMNTLVDDINSLIDLVKGMTILDTGTPSVPAGTWPIDPTTITNLTTLKSTMTTYKTTLATLLDEGSV